jgi:hypothetical protein
MSLSLRLAGQPLDIWLEHASEVWVWDPAFDIEGFPGAAGVDEGFLAVHDVGFYGVCTWNEPKWADASFERTLAIDALLSKGFPVSTGLRAADQAIGPSDLNYV